MPLKRLVWLSAGLSVVFAGTCLANHPKPAEIYLLMGQSNMSGRGSIEEDSTGALVPDPRIWVYANDATLKVAAEPLDDALGQVDAVSVDQNPGVGPGMAFAKAMIAGDPGLTIILVPCAKGGTDMRAWAPSYARSTLYGACLARARTAARFGAIRGVLWYQGESDAKTVEQAQAWPAAFEALVGTLRRDLALNDLPFVVVSLADPPREGPYATRFPHWRLVQSAQENLAMPGVTVVPAAGLPLNPDQLHLSTAAQITLGRRIAAHLDSKPK